MPVFRVCGLFVGCSFGLGGLGGLVVAYVLRLVTCYVFVLAFVVGGFVACFIGVGDCWFVGRFDCCTAGSASLSY